MTSKIKNKIKEVNPNFKDNFLLFISLILGITIIYFFTLKPINYSITIGGGILDTSEKYKISDIKSSKGVYLAYVEDIKATPLTYVLGKIFKWDMQKYDQLKLTSQEEMEDVYNRYRISLAQSQQASVYNAYKEAGKKVEVSNPRFVVFANVNNNDLKIGDELISVDGVTFEQNILKYLNDKKPTEVDVKYLRQGLEYNTKVKPLVEKDVLYLGLIAFRLVDLKVEPKIAFLFNENEMGSSGGLGISLSIYNSLENDDLFKNKKIVATGEIDFEGNITKVDGIKYKMEAAIRNEADIIILHTDNVSEANAVKEKYRSNIKVLGVSNFKEAIAKLKEA